MATRIWTKPMDRMLKRLAAQELYTADIAAKLTERFGMTITKNSVIGRAHRIGGIDLSQPGKIEKTQALAGQFLKEWMKNPENNAYRLARHKASYLLVDC